MHTIQDITTSQSLIKAVIFIFLQKMQQCLIFKLVPFFRPDDM